jgi:ADP-ribosylglycohydrolase
MKGKFQNRFDDLDFVMHGVAVAGDTDSYACIYGVVFFISEITSD